MFDLVDFIFSCNIVLLFCFSILYTFLIILSARLPLSLVVWAVGMF